MHRLLSVAVLTVALAVPASAQWPTTDWTVEESLDPEVAKDYGWAAAGLWRERGPWFDRQAIADKHVGMLRGASRWFESLGFAPPRQMTEDGDLTVGPGETYLTYLNPDEEEVASSLNSGGRMLLTTHPGFLRPNSPIWTLMEASAVHEVFHGVQQATAPGIYSTQRSVPGCRDEMAVHDWIIEGMAAAVQIHWLEGQVGRWGHPFTGSSRAAWVRHFDQPLHQPTLTGQYAPGTAARATEREQGRSWICEYGTWYFWYATGEMLAQRDEQKVSLFRHVLSQTGSWEDGGLANVDAGLREAAEAFDSIAPYRNGLYDLYPEFVAQYLVADAFYETLDQVALGAPGLFEATSSTSGGPLAPLASRAWRVTVQLPTEASSIPYAVRFSLDAPDGTDRDDLHLIVDEDVVGRPVDPTAPYATVERTDLATPTADGTLEYFVRVANVAEAAQETADAEFSLRVEVEGFYGDDEASGPTAGEVGGELPPGFVVNGPGPWACQGGVRTRAIFDLMTPDEIGRDIDRAVPELERDLDDMMDNLEITIRRLEQQGVAAGMTSEQLAALRAEAEARMGTARAEAQPDIDAAADEMRARQVTELMATFVGQADGQECQMTLGATLSGREGGAQILAAAVDDDLYPDGEAPHFALVVYPAGFLDRMRASLTELSALEPGTMPDGMATMEDPLDGWEVCTMTEEERQERSEGASGSGCAPVLCTAGQLVLERAEQGRIAGSFQFEVLKWPDETTGACRVPEGRNTVSGFFNIASTDDGFDDNSLGGLGVGSGMSGVGLMPGMPILDLNVEE